jgi:hypothetical protein
VEGSGCNQILATVSGFAWRDRRKPQKPFIEIAELLAKI